MVFGEGYVASVLLLLITVGGTALPPGLEQLPSNLTDQVPRQLRRFPAFLQYIVEALRITCLSFTCRRQISQAIAA